MLEKLYLYSTNLSSTAAIKLFTALSEGKRLRELWINNNSIGDEAGDAIMMAMKKNTSLVELWMHDNPISEECAQLIVQSLQHNNSLHLLHFPSYAQDVAERMILSAEKVNKKRKSFACKVKL